MMLEPLGEVGANFSLQLSSRTQFTKINNKKVIAENQCEKHKKSSLMPYLFLFLAHSAHKHRYLNSKVPLRRHPLLKYCHLIVFLCLLPTIPLFNCLLDPFSVNKPWMNHSQNERKFKRLWMASFQERIMGKGGIFCPGPTTGPPSMIFVPPPPTRHPGCTPGES